MILIPQDQFTIVTLSAEKTPILYDVLHCPTPCATGEFSSQAVLNQKGNIETGTLPKIPGRFTDFGGRNVVYSTSQVSTQKLSLLMHIMIDKIHFSIGVCDLLCRFFQIAGFTKFISINGSYIEKGSFIWSYCCLRKNSSISCMISFLRYFGWWLIFKLRR